MNVPHELARLLATGKATQLRLPVGRPQRLADGRTVPQHAQYRTGETYAAHAVRIIEFDGYEPTRDRDPDPVAHLRVTAVRRTTLGDRTVIDAKLEGYPTATWQDDMRDVWVRHYGDDNDDRPVWVLSVHPDHDLPQLLAWNGRPMGHLDPADHERWHGPPGSEIGYTTGTGSVREEPEAMTPDPEWVRRAERRHHHAQDPRVAARRLARTLRRDDAA